MAATAAPRDPDAVARRRLDVQIRNVGGALLLARQGEVVELSDTAAFIWRRLDGRRSIRELAHLLAAEYDVAAADVTADVAELLADLETQQLVEFS